MFSPYVCYLRVSTARQAESGSSLHTQRVACLEWLTERVKHTKPDAKITWSLYDGSGGLLEGETRDFPHLPGKELHVPMYQDGGISGASPIKYSPALRLALDTVPERGYLVVSSLDRLSRKRLRSSYIEVELDQKQATILSTMGEGTGAARNDDRLMADVKTALAYHVRREIREKIRKVVAQRRKDGKILGQIPRGYSLCSDEDTLEPRVVSEWDVRQHVIREYREGRPIGQIAFNLRAMPGGYRKRNGRFFKPKDLDALLREPRLNDSSKIPYGYSLAPGGQTLEPRVVSEWEVVQEIIRLYEKGDTFQEISDHLKTRSGGYRTRQGRFITPSQAWKTVSLWYK